MDATMRLRPRLEEFGALFSEGVETDEQLQTRLSLRERRNQAFRETPANRARRGLRAVLRLMEFRRVAHLPSTLDLIMREKLVGPSQLPDPRSGLGYADGLAGLATDLSTETMMQAYSRGLSPCARFGPVAWHSRSQRFVAVPSEVASEARASARPGQPDWSVTFDRDADAILAASGRVERSGAAAMPERLLHAFGGLFDAGFAHMFEVRDRMGRIVGGGFGVAVGRVFIIEGAFEFEVGAGRVGLVALMEKLRASNFALAERSPEAAWLGGDAFFPVSLHDYLDNVDLRPTGERAGAWASGSVVQSTPGDAAPMVA
jgi:leucyl/phenylalanyl-tRNA---protein transferase